METDVQQPAELNFSDDVGITLLKDTKSTSSDSGMVLEREPSIQSSQSGSKSESEQEESPTSTVNQRTDEVIEPQSAQLNQKSPARFASCLGPDSLLPAVSLKSWRCDEPVKLRLGESGPAAEEAISVITAFERTVRNHPDHAALAYKTNGNWEKISYKKYHELVLKAAKGFIQLGLQRFGGVGIIGFNSPEWFIADLAAIYAGGLATGIYTTNSPEACWYVADSAKCHVIVVENDFQLQKILAVWDRLPQLKAVVQYQGEPVETQRNVISWAKLISLGEQGSDDELKNRLAGQAPNLCCTLIYTSGTTGNPKGVMLSHDNLIWMTKMAGRHAKLIEKAEEVISYLPLSHVAAQILDIHIPILFAATVYFAQPDALKGSLGDTLREVRPTSFLGVPRVWEKMQEKMVAVGQSQGFLKRHIASWAKSVGLRGSYAMMNGSSSMPFGWSIANALVFRKVREALGLDRCRLCLTAAAPLMRDTLDYFASLNIQLMEAYGMSESSGPHTLGLPTQFLFSSVGKDIPGCVTKLYNSDTDGSGEICMDGRHVFMGYLNMEDKTHEALDDEGLLHSGDIGKQDENGFLFITGRIKELLITAGGENVAPVLIEDTVKECLPCVSNCMLIGDARKFLSILLTIKTEIDEVTAEPTTKLTRVARDFFAAAGSNVSDVSELLSSTPDENASKAIQKGIDATNRKAVSRAQVIQKWSVLPRDFSIPGGELGPTLKLKRPVVLQMYESTINSLYEENNPQ